MIVYNAQNYWVFRPCPSSGIPETGKHNVSETGSGSEMLHFPDSRTPDNGQSPKTQQFWVFLVWDYEIHENKLLRKTLRLKTEVSRENLGCYIHIMFYRSYHVNMLRMLWVLLLSPFVCRMRFLLIIHYVNLWSGKCSQLLSSSILWCLLTMPQTYLITLYGTFFLTENYKYAGTNLQVYLPEVYPKTEYC